MEEQYGMGDLRHYLTGRPLFPPPELLSGGGQQRNLTQTQHYEMVLMGRQVSHHHDMAGAAGLPSHHQQEFRPDGGFCGLEMDQGSGGGGGSGRWPRQETLTLLEIRSRLDPKFKEANQKGPLWDEVSRIMSEEHGYQRSGKKCREKFENLYKYYKKTKEGKAGRQDGKHYRFFRQLEALYGSGGGGGETSNTAEQYHHQGMGSTYLYNSSCATAAVVSNQEHIFQAPIKPTSGSLSLSNNVTSSEFESTSSSEEEDSDLNATVDNINNNNNSNEINRRRRRARNSKRKSWKSKIRDFIDSQMRKIMEKQEAWLEKMMRTMENKEEERALREEEWRKQEGDRIDREHKFWASERAWIESRDATLMDTLRKLTGKDHHHQLIKLPSGPHTTTTTTSSSPPSHDHDDDPWGFASRKNQIDIDHVPTTGNIIIDISNDNSSLCQHHLQSCDGWSEMETTRLIQLRTSMDGRFNEQQQQIVPEQVGFLWEEIAGKMGCFGYQRDAVMCKDKWDGISSYLIKCTKMKKRKEILINNSGMCSSTTYHDHSSSININNNNRQQQQQHGVGAGARTYSSSDTTTTTTTADHHHHQGPPAEVAVRDPQSAASHHNNTTSVAPGTSSYRFMINDTENLWDNYGMKLTKGDDHNH